MVFTLFETIVLSVHGYGSTYAYQQNGEREMILETVLDFSVVLLLPKNLGPEPISVYLYAHILKSLGPQV